MHNDIEHIYCTLQPGRRHLHYVNYTERSGPFILSLRKPPAVNAADKWAAYTDKQRFAQVGRSWSERGCEIFLRKDICSKAKGKAHHITGQEGLEGE